MPTRSFRFQCDAVNGVFKSGQLFDEVTAPNPVTDVVESTGNLLPPVAITDASHPTLFAALNAIASKSADRLAAKRAELAASLADPKEKP